MPEAPETTIDIDIRGRLDHWIEDARYKRMHALTNMGFWKADGVLQALQTLREEVFGERLA